MDPLSIAASIAGLLALTGTILSKGYACISRVKKNGGDIADMLNEVAAFSGILVGLKAQYSAADVASTPLHWLAKDHETIWQDSIKDCEKTLQELSGIVGSLVSANTINLIVKGGSMAARLEKLMTKIERFKSFFVLCLQFSSNADSKETNRLTGEILGLLHRLMDGQELLKKQIEAKDEAAKKEKMVQWLGPTSETVHVDISRGRDANSSQWLLDRTEFLLWLTSDGSANFWLWGIQGSGKTVIVSKVIESIQNQCLEEGDVVVYHYCRFSESTTLSSERLIGAMIAQLLDKIPDGSPVPEKLVKLLNKYRSSSYPSLEELEQPFHELCQYHSRIFVIIDGLDEIIDRSGILDFLNELAFLGSSFKIFVASRPEFDLEVAFESYLTVAITQIDVQSDMETYVHQRFEKLQISEDEETEEHVIVSELVERAQGMFLWAVCQIDHLSRIRTAITADVLIALPRGLESTFEDVLLRLEEEDRELALEILRVIMFSERPLDLSELVEAAAVTTNTQSLKQLRKKTLRRPADVFQLCGSLIRQSRSTGKISLAHYSVQEFLSRSFLEKGRQNQFFLQETRSLQKQFETCITYLSMEEFVSETFQETFRLAQDTHHTDSDLQVFTGAPFLEYASNHWASHLKSLGSDERKLVWPLLQHFLLGKRSSFDSWVLVSQYTHGNYKFPNGTKPIHVAVLYGLKLLTLELLKIDPRCLNLRTSDGRTPLLIALENEHEDIMDLLIQQGASLKTKDAKGRTPLHAAIESGSELAVTQLVTAGATVNAIQSDGGTPISVAVENKWDRLASFLSRMADPDILLPDGRSLLHVAAQSGSLIWTTTLLEFHEDRLIDVLDENDWCPLHYAVDKGHAEIVQKLISAKCLVNVVDKNGWSPLHAAIRRRNIQCTALILKAEWPGGRPGRATGGVAPRVTASSPRATATPSRVTTTSPRATATSSGVTATSSGVTATSSGVTATSPRLTATSPRATTTSPRVTTTSPRATGTSLGFIATSPRLTATSPTAGSSSSSDVESMSATVRRTTESSQRSEPRPEMSGKYGEHFGSRRSALEFDSLRDDRDRYDRSDPFDFVSPQRRVQIPKPKKPSPLHLALADSYVDGVELLAKHPEKLTLLGITSAEKMECLENAIKLQNSDITLILAKMVDKYQLSRILPKLLLLPSEAILEWVKTAVTVEEAYQDLIPRAIESNDDKFISTILQTWPNAEDSLIYQALKRSLYGTGFAFGQHKNGHHRLAKIFVDNGISPSKILMEQDKKSLLHSLVDAQETDFAKLIIEKGANVDFENEQGETPLLVLAALKPVGQNQNSQQTNLDLARVLVLHGANVQALDQRGRGFCHKAAAADNNKLLNYALNTLNLQPDLRDKHSRTPLLLAIESGALAAVRQLLEHIALADGNGDYAGSERVVDSMEYANMRSSPLLRALVDRAERNTTIITSLVDADEKAFGKLSRERQVDLMDLRTSFYMEALCWAIDCNFSPGFTFLLPKISKLVLFSRTNLDGDNVFHCAAGAVGADCLKTLLQRLTGNSDGIDIIQVPNAQGKTPLDIAVEVNSLEKTAILLHSGAKSTSQQMQMVKSRGKTELEALLLRYSPASNLGEPMEIDS